MNDRETARDLSKRLEKAQEEITRLSDALEWVLPMARGYAAMNEFGNNQKIVEQAKDILERGRKNMTIECEHGQLVRACNICEYEREIAQLKEDNQLLRRKIENHVIMSEDFQREYNQYLDKLNEGGE